VTFPAIAFAARAAGKCREGDATVMRPTLASTNVVKRRGRRRARGEGGVERAGRCGPGACTVLLSGVCVSTLRTVRRPSNARAQ
jgi:hypothetical protein